MAGEILQDSFLGNFPGSSMTVVKSSDISDVFQGKQSRDMSGKNVAYINILPSQRSNKQNNFVQGLEKFVDTMRGSEYICEILSSPVSESEIKMRLNGFEELYSALFPFSKRISSHGHNEGDTITEGISESISNSISTGISKAAGRSDGYTHGKHSGMNIGAHMLLNFGMAQGTQAGWSAGSNEMSTNSNTKTSSNVYGYQKSSSKTTGITDNLTVEFRNKGIENLLEKIERHIRRMKEGCSYGVWEAAVYFVSKDKKTAAIAANTYRSFLLGEDTGIEKSNFTLFDSAEEKTGILEESLKYCEHPVFMIPSSGKEVEKNTFQLLSPTNGPMSRKSTN